MFEITFQFDFLLFGLSFIATELLGKGLHPCFLMIKKKKIRIHHAYIGVALAFFSTLTGQIALLNIALGTFFNDIFSHLKKKLGKIKLR
jgi:hypothetical protein